MFGRASGFIFVLLLFISSMLGSVFILFPFVPLAYFAPKTWRFLADRFVGYWLTFPASLIEYVFNTKFYVTGDIIDRNEPALIIMNHRTRLDWMFLWNALYKMDPWLLTTEKISLKAPLKKIPGAGWAMGCGSYIFLERNFESDKATIKQQMDYYAECGNNYQLLLFPEGTDRGKRAIALSDTFAETNNLPKYEYVLHPRVTGFNFLMNLMRSRKYIKHVYDITLAYGETIVESEMQLLKQGVFPEKVHFNIQKYNIEDIPEESEELSKWLTVLWEKKEKSLKWFYEVTKSFVPAGEQNSWPVETTGFGYYLTFSFWLFFSGVFLINLYMFTIVKLYALAAILFYVYALKVHNGVEFLFLKWFNLRQKRVHIENE